ncbi:MAG: hypothetical protein K0R94_1568, partial [Burkholderiales bacterium]|nr:hypothetical protein [Burkholderiales bacterium]
MLIWFNIFLARKHKMKTKNGFSYILGVSAFAGLVLMTNVARADEPVLTGKCT